MWPSPCVSETEVVVLPSPAFVGVMAVTQTSLASGRRAEALQDAQVDLRLVRAVEVVLVRLEAELLGDLGDGAEARLLGDLEAGGHLRRQVVLLGR